MKKRIVVTKKDIKNGQRSNANSCPVALAVRRGMKVKNFEDVGVINKAPSLGISGGIRIGAIEYPIPDKVSNFVVDFDFGVHVRPFQFTLEY